MVTLRRVGLHVGHRGVFLALFGIVYLLLGYSYIGVHITPQVRHALRIALQVAPLPVYAWGWVTTGAISVLCGLFCPGRKAVGFAAAILMPAIWSLVYTDAWLEGGIPRAWVSVAVFAALAAAVAVVAGMPDPRQLEVR